MLNIPIAVQDALRDGTMRKNYKMKVNDVDPDTGERTYSYTIENDELVSESVKIDERMVTGKNLKFGLCEGSVLEFQYFNHPNINGKDVQVYLSAEYVDTDDVVKWYDIPMGWYSVDQCPMQWDTGIFKVTAYNKLKSDYLDAKVNRTLQEYFNDDPDVYLVDIIDDLLKGYGITHYDTEEIYPSVSGDNYGLSPNGVAAYKYNFLFGDQGAFAPTILWDEASITTSSQIYVNGTGYFIEYSIAAAYQDKPIRIDFDMDFDQIDESIKEFYLGEIDKISTNTDASTIWDKIYNRTVLLSNNITLPAWALQTAVIFTDNTQKIYSKTLYDAGLADGTFANLDNRTFWNVKKIILFQPYSVLYMYPNNTIYSGRNEVYCNGDNYQYEWFGNGDYHYSTCVTPTMPNGEKIPFDGSDPSDPQTLAQYASVYTVTDMAAIETLQLDIDTIPDVTLRELQSAVYETVCQYGQLDRETDLFTGVELNQGGLLPANNLYPKNDLYPLGNMEHPFPSSYQKLWTDTVGEQSFRYLIITYKGTETINGQTQEVEKVLQRTVNADGTTDYNMSDNWLFKNLVWSDADVGDYADAMVLKMQDIRWFPFEMWAVGMPYIETGDAIEITDKQGNTHTSYVLTRTLDGIQNLQDTFVNGELDIF